MAFVSTFVIAFVGLLTLALAMAKHQRDLLARPLSPAASRTLRAAGWTLFALSALPAIARSGIGAGLALWCSLSSMAAFLVVAVIVLRTKPRAKR